MGLYYNLTKTYTCYCSRRINNIINSDAFIFYFFYLSSIDRDGAGHNSFQVTAETDSLHRDDGLLGQNGPGAKTK